METRITAFEPLAGQTSFLEEMSILSEPIPEGVRVRIQAIVRRHLRLAGYVVSDKALGNMTHAELLECSDFAAYQIRRKIGAPLPPMDVPRCMVLP
jgi:hypothetical protein